MKLSEKGYLKIGNSIAGWVENGILKVTFDPNKIDFESDDFKNGVVLSVEEAFSLRGVFVSLSFSKQSKENKELLDKAISFLDKRIDQAEGKR